VSWWSQRRVAGLPDPTDGSLEDALRDLGPALDHRPGPHAQAVGIGAVTMLDAEAAEAAAPDRSAMLVEAVLARIEELSATTPLRAPADARGPARRRRSTERAAAGTGRRSPVSVRLAALAAVALAVLLAVTPTRDALAGWFGIGGVRITTVDEPPPAQNVDATNVVKPPTPSTPSTLSSSGVGEAIGELPFVVRLADPELAGPVLAVTIDPAVPSGLVEIRYGGFTLVALASQPGAGPVVEKFLGSGTAITRVTVGARARPGYWLTGAPHDVAYISPDGEIVRDTVRRVGDVLVWEDSGVTYRIEGAASLNDALAIATSLR
jgi:hypothetical protein